MLLLPKKESTVIISIFMIKESESFESLSNLKISQNWN